METASPTFDLSHKRDWKTAFGAMRALLADANDTVQVFKIMRSLNAGTSEKNYRRLLATPQGGRVAYRRVELVKLLTDRDFIAQFAPGTVGASYRAFLEKTGYSAAGLEELSHATSSVAGAEHPYAWFGRRERDIHDLWHVLSGYKADDPLGELCLVAFTYAQSNGLGWGFIALMGVLRNLRQANGVNVARAVWEGYRHGRKASWLQAEDIENVLAEPLDAARARLKIADPVRYRIAKEAAAAAEANAIPSAVTS